MSRSASRSMSNRRRAVEKSASSSSCVEEIEEQGAEAPGAQRLGDETVPGAQAAAAGSVGEDDDAAGSVGNPQLAFQADVAGRNLQLGARDLAGDRAGIVFHRALLFAAGGAASAAVSFSRPRTIRRPSGASTTVHVRSRRRRRNR